MPKLTAHSMVGIECIVAKTADGTFMKTSITAKEGL